MQSKAKQEDASHLGPKTHLTMGRGSKKRKDVAARLLAQERALKLWALAVRKQVSVRLHGESFLLEACNADLDTVILVDHLGVLHQRPLAQIETPLQLSGFSRSELDELFENPDR